MSVLVFLVLFLALTGHSSATYCICKDGLSDQVLQKALDYACGAGADCTQINQNGPCYNPNTVKDHCSYAANSYFQKKGQGTGTCDFAGAATPSQNPPTTVASTCTYPSSSSNTGSTTITPPSSTPPSTTTPSTPTPPSTTTPLTPTPPSTTTPSTTNSSTTTPPTTSGTTPLFGTGSGSTGISPTGSGTGFTDSSDGVVIVPFTGTNMLFFPLALTLWLSGLMLLWG